MSELFEVRQSADELDRRKLVGVTIASLMVTAVALAVVWILLSRWSHVSAPPIAPRTIGDLEPGLIRGADHGAQLRTEQTTALTRWRWIDRDAGVAQIPIDVAMDVLTTSPLPPDRPLAKAR